MAKDDFNNQEDNMNSENTYPKGTFEGYPPKEEQTMSSSNEKPRQRPKPKREIIIKKHIAEKIETEKKEKEMGNEEKEETHEKTQKPKKSEKKAKSSQKPAKKEKPQKEAKENERKWIVILAVLAIIGIGFILAVSNLGLFSTKNRAATVYGEKILLPELEKAYNSLPENIKPLVTKDQVLDQLISKKLLLKDANLKGITINDSEAEAQITTLLEQSGLTGAEFQDLLDERNVTYEEFKSQIKEALIINKLAEDVIFADLVISEAEQRKFYENNTDLFTTPEIINASHILICSNESIGCQNTRSIEEAYVLAKDVLSKINSTNFGEIAAQYSEEPQADITQGNLGFFKKGDMVLEFETAAFSLGINQVSPKPVETVYGYHIIKVFEREEAKMMPFSQVSEQIENDLKTQKQQLLFEDYIKNIKEKAIQANQLIIYYNSTN